MSFYSKIIFTHLYSRQSSAVTSLCCTIDLSRWMNAFFPDHLS